MASKTPIAGRSSRSRFVMTVLCSASQAKVNGPSRRPLTTALTTEAFGRARRVRIAVVLPSSEREVGDAIRLALRGAAAVSGHHCRLEHALQGDARAVRARGEGRLRQPLVRGAPFPDRLLGLS